MNLKVKKVFKELNLQKTKKRTNFKKLDIAVSITVWTSY